MTEKETIKDVQKQLESLKISTIDPKVERIFQWLAEHNLNKDDPRALHVCQHGKWFVKILDFGIDTQAGPYVVFPIPMDIFHESWCNIHYYWSNREQRFQGGNFLLFSGVDFEPGSIQAPFQNRPQWRWQCVSPSSC